MIASFYKLSSSCIFFVLSDFSNILSLPSGLELKWESGDPEWITFSMKAPTNGYIGIGFSRDGRMSQSDIYIGWVDSSTGKGHIKVNAC
jgi:hypothetical protein